MPGARQPRARKQPDQEELHCNDMTGSIQGSDRHQQRIKESRKIKGNKTKRSRDRGEKRGKWISIQVKTI